MKTKAILSAAAAAFLLANSPAFAADTQSGEPKRCYRTLHKLPYPVRVPCPKPKEPRSGVPGQPAQPQTPPSSPTPQNQ